VSAPKLSIPRRHTGSREGDEMQRLAQDVARRLNDQPFGAGRLVEGVVFSAGVDRLVDHGLGYRPSGALVLRDYGTNVCTGVGEATTQPDDVTKQIRMRSPVTCTVDLWIF
jgi:hypothetical protein